MARRKRTKVSTTTLESDAAAEGGAGLEHELRMLRRSAKLVVGKLVQRLDRQGWPLQTEKEWLVLFDSLKDEQRMDNALVLAMLRERVVQVNKMRDECTAALPKERRLALEVARVTARALYAADRAERMRREAGGL